MSPPSLADLHTQQIRHQPRQALERDRLGKAQIQHKRPQVRPERRAWFQPHGRHRLEPTGAAGTSTAIQRHARHVRHDLGNFDTIVTVNGLWSNTTHISLTMPAPLGR